MISGRSLGRHNLDCWELNPLSTEAEGMSNSVNKKIEDPNSWSLAWEQGCFPEIYEVPSHLSWQSLRHRLAAIPPSPKFLVTITSLSGWGPRVLLPGCAWTSCSCQHECSEEISRRQSSARWWQNSLLPVENGSFPSWAPCSLHYPVVGHRLPSSQGWTFTPKGWRGHLLMISKHLLYCGLLC